MKQTKWLLVLCSFCAMLMLSACGENSESTSAETKGTEASDSTGQLRMIERSELSTMDPALAFDRVSFNALNNVMEGLYRQGPNNQMELGMAAAHPEVTNDGKTYTFQLQEDAVWSNGEPVTADDFVFSWRRAVDPETGAPYRHLFSGVVKNAEDILAGKAEPTELGVHAPSEKTLVVELEKDHPYLEKLLSLPIFFPLNQTFLEETGEAFGTDASTVLSNGPFMLTEWSGTGLTWDYEKNTHYWDRETVKLNKVTVNVLKEPSTALTQYENDEVDWIPANGNMLAQFNRPEEIRDYPTSSIVFIKFNLMRNNKPSPLANSNIRKALALSVNKEELNALLKNEAEPAGGIVPAGVAVSPGTKQDFRKENGSFLNRDLELAQRFFEKGLRELNRHKVTLELSGDDTESAIETMKYLQTEWMEAFPQLEITIQSIPFSKRLKKDATENYDIQLSGWAADFSDPINFLEIWESTSPQNRSNYTSETFDALMKEAKTTTNEKVRWERLLEAERVLLEDGVVVPLYQPFMTALSKTNVKGVFIHPAGPALSLKWASIEG